MLCIKQSLCLDLVCDTSAHPHLQSFKTGHWWQAYESFYFFGKDCRQTCHCHVNIRRNDLGLFGINLVSSLWRMILTYKFFCYPQALLAGWCYAGGLSLIRFWHSNLLSYQEKAEQLELLARYHVWKGAEMLYYSQSHWEMMQITFWHSSNRSHI